MARLLGFELLLTLLTALFAAAGVPWLAGAPARWPLFLVGFMMALAFVALYALAQLAGRRLSAAAKLAVGVIAFAAVFGPAALGRSPAPGQLAYLPAAMAGGLLALVGAVRRRGGESLFAYAAPLLAVRYLLVPLLGASPDALSVALQCGAFYLCGRGLVGLFAPAAPDGRPLVHRPVPDRVVGLVEALSRRSARPFATRSDGSLDEAAIAILCRAEEADDLAARIRAALAGEPLAVAVGQRVDGRVELVIRPEGDGRP